MDEFDVYTQSGWSVLIRGGATYVESADLPDAMTGRTRGRKAWRTHAPTAPGPDLRQGATRLRQAVPDSGISGRLQTGLLLRGGPV